MTNIDKKVIFRFKKMFEGYLVQFGKMGGRSRLESALMLEAGGDAIDYANASHERHIYTRHFERERSFLHSVKEALDRIMTGSFGNCQECGGFIGLKRLEIKPTSSLCVHCQESLEADWNSRRQSRSLVFRKIRLLEGIA